MRLPLSTVIDLEAFEGAALSFVSLIDLPIGEGETALDPRFSAEIEEAVDRFGRWASDRPESEPAVRNALAWLLNLDPDRFERVVTAMDLSFPVRGDLRVLRRFLELLWDGTFADWRVRGFDPDAYEVRGLRT